MHAAAAATAAFVVLVFCFLERARGSHKSATFIITTLISHCHCHTACRLTVYGRRRVNCVRQTTSDRKQANMFKWVMPASRSIAATPTATTITTAIRTATARKTTKAAAATTTKTSAATTATLTKRQLLSNALTTLVIIGALFVQTTSGFRSSIDANGGK